jgi:hypothetical protein
MPSISISIRRRPHRPGSLYVEATYHYVGSAGPAQRVLCALYMDCEASTCDAALDVALRALEGYRRPTPEGTP